MAKATALDQCRALVHHFVCRMMAACFYGHWNLVLETSNRLDFQFEVAKVIMFRPFLQLRMFYGGLAAGILGQKKPLATSMQRLSKWTKQGTKNCEHMLLLLQAEESRMKKEKLEVILRKFRSAVRAGAESGCRHHEALACEQLAYVLLSENKDASAEIERARDLYAAWGAQAKAQHMTNLLVGKAANSKPIENKRSSAPRTSQTVSSTTDILGLL